MDTAAASRLATVSAIESPTFSSSTFPFICFTRWPTMTLSHEVPILVTDVPAEGVSATLVTIPAIPVGRSYSTLPRSVQASADLFSLSEAAYTWLRGPNSATFVPTAKIIANVAQALRATKLCTRAFPFFFFWASLLQVVTCCKLLFNFIFFFPCTSVMF